MRPSLLPSLVLALTLASAGGTAANAPESTEARVTEARVTEVRVMKAARMMELVAGGEVVRRYPIVLGASPVGHKQQEGDERTPEGRYVLNWRNPNSQSYKSIHISYPNADDKAAARRLGVSPGGFIMIHGQPNGFGWAYPLLQLFDWTDGCIAVTNGQMEEIWAMVENGTPIEIMP